MRKKTTWTWIALCVAATIASGASVERQTIVEGASVDEPQARALYEGMIRSMRDAVTLYYESSYHKGHEIQEADNHGTYKVWLKKPNCFRLETRLGDDDRFRGIVVGDGQYAWSHWPNGRPYFGGEDEALHAQTRFNVYMQQPAPAGKYSIRYSTVMKKSNFFPPVDPSRFFGVECSLEPFIDWIRGMGVEKVGDEDCRLVEISYLDHGQSCYLWISQQDGLPRRLRQVIRGVGDEDHVSEEQWSRVTLNAEMPAERFSWKPPEGWRQWQPPTPEDKLLKPGRMAPDFKFKSLDGQPIALSAWRGKIVWLTFWRVQCPPCRDEIPYLEKLHREYGDKGLVVLGFDFVDDVKSATDFLREHSATFPCIVDSSDEAVKTAFFTYGATAAPVNYIIDRDGKVAAAWLGYDKSDKQGPEALAALGLHVTP